MNLEGFTERDPGKLKVPKVGIGMLGYGFMGKTHTNAFKKISYQSWTWPPPAIPELIAICGRNAGNLRGTNNGFLFFFKTDFYVTQTVACFALAPDP